MSQMNTISSFQIYCFYPWMTINGISISGKGSPTTYDIEQLERQSMEYNWSRLCGTGHVAEAALVYGI